MITLNNLPKIKARSKKRVGRGYGSGKGGHTVGRGQKGQKTRGKINPLFEGTKVKKSLIQRLPMIRGKGKLKPKPKPYHVNIEKLNLFKDNDTININSLIKNGVLPEEARRFGAKILDNGKLKKKLKVTIPATKKASEKIIEAGGQILK